MENKLSFSEMNEAIRPLSEQHKVDYVFSHVAPLKFDQISKICS